MKLIHDNSVVRDCGMVLNKASPWLNATADFLCSCSYCRKGCGEVKCPHCIEKHDFVEYASKPASCLELVDGLFYLKNDHIYYYQVQQQLFTTKSNYCDFVVCAFDEKNQPVFVHQRIVPYQAHWDWVTPKLETIWRVCILSEILGTWYTRKIDLSSFAEKKNW